MILYTMIVLFVYTHDRNVIIGCSLRLEDMFL